MNPKLLNGVCATYLGDFPRRGALCLNCSEPAEMQCAWLVQGEVTLLPLCVECRDQVSIEFEAQTKMRPSDRACLLELQSAPALYRDLTAHHTTLYRCMEFGLVARTQRYRGWAFSYSLTDRGRAVVSGDLEPEAVAVKKCGRRLRGRA